MALPTTQLSTSNKYAVALLVCWLLSVSSAQSNGLQFVAAPDLPANFTADIDVVFVYSQSVLNQLPFEQFGWVSTREELIEQFASDIDVVSVQVTSAFAASTLPLPARHDEAVAVLVFASHEDPVAEGIDITGETSAVLRVESWGISVE